MNKYICKDCGSIYYSSVDSSSIKCEKCESKLINEGKV